VLGKANKLQKEMYDTIFRAQAAGCQAVKDGVHGTKADKAVRKEIDKKFIEYYYPGLGHGVGLEIHENPFIKNTCDFVFRKNMTLTIEPGIYLPGIGGLRIEDTIRVGVNDYESLSRFPRELIEL
jgi:Xaa-Pro aminopeptidase